MSEENVEIVRRVLGAWGRGDRKAVADLLDPEIEWSMPPNIPEAGTYHGRAEVVRRLEEFLEAWDDLAVTVEELVDAGDRVVALVRYSGRGRESGIEIAGMSTDAQVWTLRNGRALRVELYGGTAEALEAAGLSE
jgi:ketosteroid isomerase-like protein